MIMAIRSGFNIAFYTYHITFLSKKLNVEKKLTGKPSPTVYVSFWLGCYA